MCIRDSNAGLYMMQMRYGLVLNLSVLSSMAETNFQEACAFCTPASIAGTLLLAGFISLAIYWSRRSLRQKATWGALACIWGLYAALLLLSIPAASYKMCIRDRNRAAGKKGKTAVPTG